MQDSGVTEAKGKETLWCLTGSKARGKQMFARWLEGDLLFLPFCLVIRGGRKRLGGGG